MIRDMTNKLKEFFSGFVTKNEKFLFTTLARILAIGCLIVAAFYVWKLAGQINL